MKPLNPRWLIASLAVILIAGSFIEEPPCEVVYERETDTGRIVFAKEVCEFNGRKD